MVTLFDEINRNSNNYILISEALEGVALHEGSLFKAVIVLLHHRIDEVMPCYELNDYLEYVDIDNTKKPKRNKKYSAYEILEELRQILLTYEDKDSLKIVPADFKIKINKYFWLKENYFNFDPIISMAENVDGESLNGQYKVRTNEKKRIATLKAELAQAQERIKQLEENKNIEVENDNSIQPKGLTLINQSAKDRQGMARVIAKKLWANDESILISEMADKVYKVMVDYCMEDLPQNIETLKNWIRPVAPKEATKKGRPSSKSTT